MNLHTAREHRNQFRQAVVEAQDLPKAERLGFLNTAWRRHGLPVQEASVEDPFALGEVFGQLLTAYGRATGDAQMHTGRSERAPQRA